MDKSQKHSEEQRVSPYVKCTEDLSTHRKHDSGGLRRENWEVTDEKQGFF